MNSKGSLGMKKVVIVGAGGLARMIYSWLPSFIDEQWEPIGFISDKLDILDLYNYKIPILGTISEYQPEEDHVLVMAIADPRDKLAVAEDLENRGGKFINLIHPTVVIGKNVEIGKGCVILPRAVLTCDIKIGDFVLINLGVTIGHDVLVGDGCTINSHSDVTGFAQLGNGVFLGSHAVITPNIKIKDFAKIGAGSVVVKQVKTETTVFGIPAKKI
jgi:sugar O-acyltransferase (sialic acid O-acetyltransferase NeuD family)